MSIIITAIAVSSCAHIRYVPLPEVHTRDSMHLTTDHRYDSIYIDRWHTLILRGDTVFRTDSIYVEKLRDIEVHDTIRITHTDTIPVVHVEEVIREVPTPIPRGKTLIRDSTLRFYRNSTIGLFLFLSGILLYIALRLYRLLK